MQKLLHTLVLSTSLLAAAPSFSADISSSTPSNPVNERLAEENHVMANPFAITFYEPTYLLPYYYTVSSYSRVYQNRTPDDQKIKHADMRYQLSFKVPIWKDILHHPSSLYLAYSQLSYWQAYNQDAFFRETDYQPEIFLANALNYNITPNWQFSFFNLGASHQSNGYGGVLERSWNRVYVEAVSSIGNLMVSVRPWYVLHDHAIKDHNPDIAKYLGYGRLVFAYKLNDQVISLSAHNLIENHARRATAELTWSFPVTRYIKGYAQVFSGYGQSLIEYNHRTNSAGIGIALSDWV